MPTRGHRGRASRCPQTPLRQGRRRRPRRRAKRWSWPRPAATWVWPALLANRTPGRRSSPPPCRRQCRRSEARQAPRPRICLDLTDVSPPALISGVDRTRVDGPLCDPATRRRSRKDRGPGGSAGPSLPLVHPLGSPSVTGAPRSLGGGPPLEPPPSLSSLRVDRRDRPRQCDGSRRPARTRPSAGCVRSRRATIPT
jgi:hypothetical protein